MLHFESSLWKQLAQSAPRLPDFVPGLLVVRVKVGAVSQALAMATGGYAGTIYCLPEEMSKLSNSFWQA